MYKAIYIIKSIRIKVQYYQNQLLFVKLKNVNKIMIKSIILNVIF